MKKIILILSILVLANCYGSYNKDYITNDLARETWEKQGFKVVAYEGYSWGCGCVNYGGAQVWHRLKKIPDNGVTYSGFLVKWGDEIHVYGPKALEKAIYTNKGE